MIFVFLFACIAGEARVDVHARCGVPIECDGSWWRRCSDPTGALAHWDRSDGRVAVLRPEACDAVER